MHDRDGMIWYDGELVPWRSATTHVLTHSLHYGLAVFEGVRAYATAEGTALFRLEEHTARLAASAHACLMSLPFRHEELVRAQLEAVRANALEHGYVRTIAFYGPEKLGVSPRGARVHVAVAAFPWGSYLGDGSEHGIRVKTSSFTRPPPSAALPRAKVAAGYLNSILAHLEASEEGYDEALLLDSQGFVAEGAGENLFIVQHGQLFEPEPSSALLGITRGTLLTLAREFGLHTESRRLSRDDVYLADEAFFCGTAAEVTPIIELDRRRIGSGAPGPLTLRLRAEFARVTSGRSPRHRDWLTPVPFNSPRCPGDAPPPA